MRTSVSTKLPEGTLRRGAVSQARVVIREIVNDKAFSEEQDPYRWDQNGRGPFSYFLKRMAALTPPKPAEMESAIRTSFSLASLGT
jgi:hypothetical protein